jgi:hypothetical protein
MMKPWMKDVFVRAEKKSLEQQSDKRDIDTSYAMGKSIFMSLPAVLVLLVFLSVAYMFLKRRNFIRKSHKRKK